MWKHSCAVILVLAAYARASVFPAALLGAGDQEALQDAAAEVDEPGQLGLRIRLQGPFEGLNETRVYQRLEWRLGRGRKAFLLTEKDPGEKRWADFAAFYLQWQGRASPLQVFAGDVRPGFAQGLVFGRSSRRRSPLSATLRDDSKYIGYRSSAENQALRGLALRYGGRGFEAVAVGGRARRDARLDEDGTAVSLPEDGIHVSAGEEAGRKRLQAWTAGLRLRWVKRRWQVGASLQGMRFNRRVDLRRPEKTPWAFRGRDQYLGGLDFKVVLETVRSALEAGRDHRGHWGILSFTRIRLGKLRLKGLVRYYAPGFHSFYGGSASAAGMQNERGYLLALEGRWRRQKWRFLVDQFAPVQPAYASPVLGVTEVWSLGTEHPLAPRWHAQLLYQDRKGPRWRDGASHSERSRRGRVGITYRAGPRARVGFRLEGRCLRDTGRGSEIGGMTSLLWQGKWGVARYTFHLSRFSTASYRTRIYEFEYDLPGTVSIRPLYGDGWRFYLLAGFRWRPVEVGGRYRYQRRLGGEKPLHYFGLQVDCRIGGARA